MIFLEWVRAYRDLFTIIMIICLLISYSIFRRHHKTGRMVKGDSGYFWRLCRSGDRDGMVVIVSSVLTVVTAILKTL